MGGRCQVQGQSRPSHRRERVWDGRRSSIWPPRGLPGAGWVQVGRSDSVWPRLEGMLGMGGSRRTTSYLPPSDVCLYPSTEGTSHAFQPCTTRGDRYPLPSNTSATAFAPPPTAVSRSHDSALRPMWLVGSWPSDMGSTDFYPSNAASPVQQLLPSPYKQFILFLLPGYLASIVTSTRPSASRCFWLPRACKWRTTRQTTRRRLETPFTHCLS